MEDGYLMKVLAEVFKGIEFIRICNLPEDQKEFIAFSISKDNIIKILKDNVVMKDCIQYHVYLSLYSQYKAQSPRIQTKPPSSKKIQSVYKLAVK